MQWTPIGIWTGLSGGFDWSLVLASRNSWLRVQRPVPGSGVLVFCDPKTWPKDPEQLRLSEGFPVAVGVHPKHASQFGDCYFDQLSRLVDSPAVTALGEIGLDCSEGAKPFARQYSTLLWALSLARPYMPLVLHVRASGKRTACTGGYWGRCWRRSQTLSRGSISTASTGTWPQSSSGWTRTLKPTLVSP